MFWTTLIEVTTPYSQEAKDTLDRNCTHVKGPYWIMEGEVDYLRDEGIELKELKEGAVDSLGDLTTEELVQVCLASYGIDLA